jgi:hypothetical protein
MYNRILIVERQKLANGNFEIELSFNDNQVYTLVVNNPFSAKKEQQLEQYFEEYLRFPFTDEVTYQQIATSIIEYGEFLFQQIFQTRPEISQTYQQISQSGQIKVEIIGKSLEFNAIHWESLKNPQNRQPFAITHPVIRKPFLKSKSSKSILTLKYALRVLF